MAKRNLNKSIEELNFYSNTEIINWTQNKVHRANSENFDHSIKAFVSPKYRR